MAGFKNFTSATLTASDVNGYLMKQAVIQCTSSTRPTGVDGMVIFETDTKETLQYYATAAVWRRLWNMPWGVMAQASASTSSSASGGTTGVLTAPSFAAIANRRYRITISYGGTIQVGAGASEVQIRRGAGTTLITSARNAAAGTVPGCSYAATDTTTAGAVVYGLYTFTTATTVQLQSNYEIIVEDIGPTSATVA